MRSANGGVISVVCWLGIGHARRYAIFPGARIKISTAVSKYADFHWREKYVAARLYVAHKNDVFYTQKYENKKNFIKNIVEIDSDEVVTSWPSLIAEK